MVCITPSLVAVLLGTASAHMQMQYPPPLLSKFNPHTPPEDINFDMASPLAKDGSDFPCKGYLGLVGTSAAAPTAVWYTGSYANVTIVGGTTHDGGSCQISLSADGGKKFTAVQSIIGGCPSSDNATLGFMVPADAPLGDVLVAWTWFNRVGSRDMFMNCASVTIEKGDAQAHGNGQQGGTAFEDRPGMFVANLDGASDGCSTQEMFDVVFPAPGPNVVAQSWTPKLPSCGVMQHRDTDLKGDMVGLDDATGSRSKAATIATSSLFDPFALQTAGSDLSIETDAETAATTVPPMGPVVDPFTLARLPSITRNSALASATFDFDPFTMVAAPVVQATEGPEATFDPFTVTASPLDPATTASSDFDPFTLTPSGSRTTLATVTSRPEDAGSSLTSGAPGSLCSQEGVFVCLAGDLTYQRCASGQWSVVMPVAPGTTCSQTMGRS